MTLTNVSTHDGHEGSALADTGQHSTAAQMDESTARLIDRTIADGFSRLRFPKVLEDRYVQETTQAREKQGLLLTAMAMLASNLFIIPDWFMIRDVFDVALIVRLWIVTPLLLMMILWGRQLQSAAARQRLFIVGDVLVALTHLSLCVLSESEHALAYTVAISVLTMYSGAYMRTYFWVSVIACVSTLALYPLALLFMPNPAIEIAAPIALMLVSVGVFTLYHLYVLEHEDRRNYLLTTKHFYLQKQLTSANEQLTRVARVDALTQLANRRHFDQYLEQLWERAKQDDADVCILMVDVDCFKAYNDSYGHPAGDACLVKVAQTLSTSLRRPGDLIARYGGEEFIAVLYKTSLDQARAAAERVCQAVRDLRMENKMSFVKPVVTVSVGVATLRASARHATPQKLIQSADQALYQAKNRGRNQVWIESTHGWHTAC